MLKCFLFSLVFLSLKGWSCPTAHACRDCPSTITSPKSLVLSINGHKNSTGHWVTKFSLNTALHNCTKKWKLDIKHNVTVHEGIQQLHLHGVFSGEEEEQTPSTSTYPLNLIQEWFSNLNLPENLKIQASEDYIAVDENLETALQLTNEEITSSVQIKDEDVEKDESDENEAPCPVTLAEAVIGTSHAENMVNACQNDSEHENGDILLAEIGPDPRKGNRRLNIVSRKEWNAKEPRAKSRLPHPVSLVIVRDEHITTCNTPEECIVSVQRVQEDHRQAPYGLDIDANFLIAGDGRVYEGRGWDFEVDQEFKGLVISFLGRYDVILPTRSQIEAFDLLVEEGVTHGEISPDYKLKAFGQLYLNGYPGDKLYEHIKKWKHWTDVPLGSFSSH